MGGAHALRFSCGTFTRTRPLLEGRITVPGFALDIVPDPFPAAGLLPDYQARRNLLMTNDKAFDVCELGLAPLLAARSRGLDLVAIPVFHYRRFRHGAIVCRTAAGITKPEDLVGKRVGVRRLSLSAGMWARGLLEHEYGLPLDRIDWCVQVETPLRPEIAARLRVTVVPSDVPMGRFLETGEIDACIEAFAVDPLKDASPDVHPLFEDVIATEIDYYQRTGVFPIMHTIVMWRALADQHPDLPLALQSAFEQAQAEAAAQPDTPTRYVLAEEERQWVGCLSPEQRKIFFAEGGGPEHPWKYSLREDRKTVDTFLDYAYEQGIAHRRFAVEELFHASTLDR